MKEVSCVVFAGLFMGSVIAQAPTCQDGVEFIPHPTNCNWYYICRNGRPIINACPPELWWNPTTNSCDDPEQAGCIPGGSTTTGTEVTITDTTTTDTDTTDIATDTTTLSSEETTSEPEGISTTPDTPTEPPEPPGNLPDSCLAVEDPNEKIRLPHATNCALYYLCQQGTPIAYTCNNGNHFSPTLRVCHPYNEAGCDRCPDVDVVGDQARLPHATDCQKYYLCVNKKPVLYQCRMDWHFRRNSRECVAIEEAECTL